MIVVLCLVAALGIGAAAAGLVRARRNKGTARLQQKFGSEYDAAVTGPGRKKGEADLHGREARVKSFELRPLVAAEAERFSGLWTATQARFVDDPGGAITDADRLLSEVMEVRGYPVSDFEQRASDLSVDHPEFVANYRAAHGEAVKHSRGETSTEGLRRATVNYRWLFQDLVAVGEKAPVA